MFAETLVSNLKKEYEMKWMIFSVMDAKTGAIVASSTYPNLDPNDLNTITSKLWAMANELRGNMDASEYKNYILAFMFYRYLSENLVNYVNTVLKRITIVGAIFLAALAILPIVFDKLSNLTTAISISGTGLLIVVGVALEMYKQLESQLVSRTYTKGRRGRRRVWKI